MKKFLALLVAVVLVFALAACAAQNSGGSTSSEGPASFAVVEDGKLNIGVSLANQAGDGWYRGVAEGCRQWLEMNGADMDVEIDFTFKDAGGSAEAMQGDISAMVGSGANGIIVLPVDETSVIPTIRQYTAEGVPFVVGGTAQNVEASSDAVWSTFVGYDNYTLGKMAGEIAVEYLQVVGNANPVCVFISSLHARHGTAAQFSGFRDTVLEAFAGAGVVVMEEQEEGGAAAAIEQALQTYGTVDVVVGYSAAAAMDAYNASMSLGHTGPRFVALGCNSAVLGMLAEGNPSWLGAVLQDPVALGYQATEAMVRVLRAGDELPVEYTLAAPQAITPQNIAEYDWQGWGWL